MAGKKSAAGEIGEICFSGPQVFTGYYNDEQNTAKAVSKDGVCYTGDMGYYDNEGLHFAGRGKFIIKPRGFNVYPQDVVNHISRKLGARAAAIACIGVPHDIYMEAIMAFVEPAPGTVITPEEVIDSCSDISIYSRPSHAVILEPGSMPLNRVAKIDYMKLKKQGSGIVDQLREKVSGIMSLIRSCEKGGNMLIGNIPVLRSIFCNFNSTAMNREMIGYTLKKDFGPFGLEEIQQFADATCDDFTKYSGVNSPVPPLFFSKELYPLFKQIITHKDLNLNLIRMVHGSQSLRLYTPISHNDKISIEMTIADIIDTAAGEVLHVKTKGISKGKLIFEADTGFVVRRPGKRSDGKSKREKYALRNLSGNEEVEFLIHTVKGQEMKYARVSKDTIPIHTNALFAKAVGLPGRILHGACVMAMCTNTLIDGVADRDPLRFREVSGRFSYPVVPGETLTVKGYRTVKNGHSGIRFNVYSESGKTVINKGMFIYN